MENQDLLTEIRSDYKAAKKSKRVKKSQPEVVEKKGMRFVTKLKIGLVGLVLVVTGVAYAAEGYVDWRAEHEWQFPARWIGLVRKIELATGQVANAETVKVLTDTEVIEQYHLSPVLKTSYFLESTSGQKDGCKDEGKFNGYGFRQNGSEWKCYDSFEEVTEEVNEWFEERLSVNGNDLIEAVCYYNKGIAGMNACGDYSANFFSVLTKNF